MLTDEEVREKVAAKIWVVAVRNATLNRGKMIEFEEEDFVTQVLIDKTFYYEQADQIINLVADQEDERESILGKDTVMDYSDMVNHPIISESHTELDKGYDEGAVAKAQAKLTRAETLKEVGRSAINRADAGLDALPEKAAHFWVGYWWGLKDWGKSLLREELEKNSG